VIEYKQEFWYDEQRKERIAQSFKYTLRRRKTGQTRDLVAQCGHGFKYDAEALGQN
jgi:hypothetical protein